MNRAPFGTIPSSYSDNDRGFWSTSFEAQLIFYNPAVFMSAVFGTMAAYKPQPYASFSLDPFLWNLDKVKHPDFIVSRNKNRVGGVSPAS